MRTIEFTTEILSGIPSIIFGLFGMVFFGMTLKLGYSVLTGSFTLTLMVLPLITRNTPGSTQNSSGQLPQRRTGNRCNEMVYDPDDPAAERGTGILTWRHPFGLARIVGESAALLFTAGSGFQLPKNLFGKLFESSGTLTIQLYLSMQKAKYDQAFGIAVVLLIIVLVINLLTRFLTNRFDVTKLK